MTSAVQLPYEYYPDPDKGKPISRGNVYVGIVNLDPEIEANRKDLLLEQEDGTLVPFPAASQPLQTGAGGVVLYNGSPVKILVDGAYSIKVTDFQGAQKYYSSNVTSGVPLTEDTGVRAVDSLADLIALNPSGSQTVYVRYRSTENDGYEDDFSFITGDQSANVVADPRQGIWVAPGSSPLGNNGAWKRQQDGIILAIWFDVDPTGALDSQPGLAAADALGPVTVTEGTYKVSTSFTFSDDVTFNPGALLSIDTTKIVTFAGLVLADDQHIFTGAGDVDGADGVYEFPLIWFGVVPITVSDTNQSVKINKAFAFAEQGSRTINAPNASIRCDDKLVTKGGITIKGGNGLPSVGGSTILDFSNAASGVSGLEIDNAGAQIFVANLENIRILRDVIDIKGSGSVGCQVNSLQGSAWKNVFIDGFDINLVLDSAGVTPGTGVFRCTFDNVNCISSATESIDVRCAVDCTFNDLLVSGGPATDRLMSIREGTNALVSNAIHFNDSVFVDGANIQPELVRITRTPFWINFTRCVFEESTDFGIILQYLSDQDKSLLNLSLIDCWFNNTGICVFNAGAYTNINISGGRMEPNTTCNAAISYDTSSAPDVNTHHLTVSGVTIKFGGAAQTGISFTKIRGARVSDCTIWGFGAAVARPTILDTATCDSCIYTGNSSITTFATADGFSTASTNLVSANNTKTSA